MVVIVLHYSLSEFDVATLEPVLYLLQFVFKSAWSLQHIFRAGQELLPLAAGHDGEVGVHPTTELEDLWGSPQ